MRTTSVILGIGLAILWLVGLGSPIAAAWLTWLDGVGAVCAFVHAGTVGPDQYVGAINRRGTAMGAFAIAAGLFALWIIGMSTNGAPFQNWWTFIFACAFTVEGLIGMRPVRTVGVSRTGTVDVDEEEKYRRSA